jgi:phosphatidylglycerophosphate synthase
MTLQTKAQTSQRVTTDRQSLWLMSPLASFWLQVGLVGCGLTILTWLTLPTVFWVLFAFFLASALAGLGLATSYPHSVLGLCNTVTLLRAALVAFLFGTLFVADTVSGWVIFCIGAGAFAMDGLDGWLARRSGLKSDFGARFDMETDAALGAVLALWLMLSGITQAEVLILGFARYAFVVAGWAIPRLQGELRPSFRRKTICVVQIAALLILICPLAPPILIAPISISASIALSYSFAVDIRWLLSRNS